MTPKKTEEKPVVEKPVVERNQTILAIIRSTKEAESLLKFSAIKEQIKEFAMMCSELEIVDEASEQRANELFGMLNAIVKKVEETRKTRKAPYHSSGKFIDQVAKDMTGDAENVLADGRKKVAVYRDAERKKEAEKQRLEAEELAKQQVAVDITADNAIEAVVSVYIREKEAIVACNNTQTIDQLIAWHAHYSNINSPTCVFLKDRPEDVVAIGRMFRLKDARKAFLQTKDLPAWLKASNAIIEEVERAHRVAIGEIKEVQQEKAQEIAVATTSVEIAMNTKKTGRFVWDFEIQDESAIPKEWLQLNEDMVVTYIQQNKAILTDGFVYNGIRFYSREIVIFK